MSECKRCKKPLDDHNCHDGGWFICDDAEYSCSDLTYPAMSDHSVKWVRFEDEAPPYDTRVIVRGEKHEIATAFNTNYPPDFSMTMICGDRYMPLEFQPEYWMLIPEEEFGF